MYAESTPDNQPYGFSKILYENRRIGKLATLKQAYASPCFHTEFLTDYEGGVVGYCDFRDKLK